MQHRYFIELSYKGTRYHGWQVQPNAASVQEEVNRALSVLFRAPVETVGAGRTDTGVHARQLFAHFDLDTGLRDADLSRYVHQLNCILPADIALRRIIPVPGDAHSRFDAVSRTYEYWIYSHKNPFLEGYAYFVSAQPDIPAMNAAAKLLYRYEDFSCFSKSNTQVFTNNCTVMQAEWKLEGDRAVFTIRANRFLRNMVRAVVGTLLEVGQGKMDERGFAGIIENKNRSQAGTSVPACGLYLTHVEYPYIQNL
jgi:tRNA pseudouridine38-40 synthase